jgi:hypothetical protein
MISWCLLRQTITNNDISAVIVSNFRRLDTFHPASKTQVAEMAKVADVAKLPFGGDAQVDVRCFQDQERWQRQKQPPLKLKCLETQPPGPRLPAKS